ncbi:MAG: VOC family protein [Geodermatophilaceae bacterium]|nr:VOC family protein [Geodermatophilaceae bacterium]
MTSAIHNITLDCADPYRLALFWAELTGWTEDPDDGNAPEDPEALLISPDGSLHLLFIAGPDVKTVKNRLHLDLRPTDRSRDEEVARLLALGASLVDDRRRPDGTGWAVLADPEGNEFCVETSAAERSTAEPAAT